MNVLRTKIYEYKIWLGNLMDYVIGEQARRVYAPGSDRETEASMAYTYMMTEEDVHWFKEYLLRGMAETCTVLQPLQKYLDEPFQMDELSATLRFRLSLLYQTALLENEIRAALGNYICYRWFLMKGLTDAALMYRQLYDEAKSNLKGFGVRGIHGRSVACRPYDMGLGSFRPLPYEEADVVIRDIRWDTAATRFEDLYGPHGKMHMPEGPRHELPPLPGITVCGPSVVSPEKGGEFVPGLEDGDLGMVSGGIPDREVVIRPFNGTGKGACE